MKANILKLIFSFTIILTFLDAKEVLKEDVDKQLPMISVASFTSQNNAKNLANKLHETYDIYTRFQNEIYYQFIVNIDPNEKDEVLQQMQKIVPDAYFIKKDDFEYGIKFFSDVQIPETSDVFENTEIEEVSLKELFLEKDDTEESKNIEKKESIEKKDEEIYTQEEYEIDGLIKVDLIDAVLQTLSRSYKVQAAREKLIQAKKDIDIVSADFKPSINAGYNISRTRREPGDEDANGQLSNKKEFNDERFSLTLDQNVYAGGESNAKLKKIKIDYLTAKNTYRSLIESEVSKAISSYFDIVFRREALEVNKKNIEQLQTIFDLVQAKFENGALSVGELSNVEASIANAMSQLSQTESQYNNAIEYYKFITGNMFEDTYPYQKEVDITIEDFEVVKQNALTQNNKLKNFDYLIASKKHSLQMAESAFRPKVDFQLSASKITDKEDYQYEEDEYMARLSVSYNLYNGGRDKASYLQAYSAIRETKYEKEAEIREIIWNLEKQHTSLVSLQESIKSIKDEVISSQKMVDAYWEGFRYGEQDLYILLQAQRQLNTAQLDLIDSQLGRNSNFFKILEVSGRLIEYFDIDIDNTNFLDMAKGRYLQRVRAIETNKEYSKVAEDDNTTEEEESVLEEKSVSEEDETVLEDESFSLQDFLSFSEMFLIQESQDYTIVFEDFLNIYEVLEFLDSTKINSKAFVFRALKDEKIKTHIAYEVFKSKKEAQTALELEKFQDLKAKSIMKVGVVQDKWLDFNEMALMKKQEIKPTVIEKVVPPAPFKTDKAFKTKFLNADPEYFTINITTFQTIDDAAKVVQSHNIKNNSFVFEYGEQKQFVKLMYGVYESYEEAQKALEQMGPIRSIYIPIIEKIDLKQNLYKRYHK